MRSTPGANSPSFSKEVETEEFSPLSHLWICPEPPFIFMYRLTALTDRLIRFQYHPEGRFDDRPSFLAVDRPEGRVLTPDDDGIYRIPGGEIHLRGSGPFSAENTEVIFPMGRWHYGQTPIGAVGGTTRTLDGTAGDPPVAPGILSLDGWAWLDDSGTVRLDSNGWVETGADEGQDGYLFLHGHDFRGALADFIKLSGKPSLPPRALLGMWWSRYWRYSDQDLRGIVGEFRENNFPLDVLVLDMDWHLALDWSGYTWNKELFPDPQAFLDWCHEEGLKTTLNLHPSNGVQHFDEDYEDFAGALGHPADGSPVTFTCSSPLYMEQYFRRLHHPREDEGVDFWWMDWQQGDVCEMPGLDPLAWLNHLHHVDHDRSDRRGVMLSRWGGWGGHRYPIQFSGDTHTRWETLASQVDFTAGSAASLAGWWSHDIGGHLQPTPPELYARWVQWGAWSPTLRLHSSNNPKHERRPWAFGPEVEEACRLAVEMRMRYFPLWIALAHRFSATGIAPLTPMWFDHPEDKAAHAARHQAMLGDNLLIAPIVAPMEDGRAERLVWLPKGTWVDGQNETIHEGDTFLIVAGDLQRIPFFIRAGTVLPIDPRERRAIAAIDPTELHFECWPGNGEGIAIEDEGEGDGWKRGEVAHTSLRQEWDSSGVTLTLSPTTGRFVGLPARRTVHIHLRMVEKPNAVDGPEGLTWEWEKATLVLHLPPQLVSEGAKISCQMARIPSSSPALALDHPRIQLSPRYDRRQARLSLADLVLIPPTGGAEATVTWHAEQGDELNSIHQTGPVKDPVVLPCPFSWNENAGALRWSASVEWAWEGNTHREDFSCVWDLFTGLGEWQIYLLSDLSGIEVNSLHPAEPLPGDNDWEIQSYRQMREESLLDGPRLWCDSKLADRFGLTIGMFAPNGQMQEMDLPSGKIHLAAVSTVVAEKDLRVKFQAKGLAEKVHFAVDGQKLTLDEKKFTPILNLTKGEHQIQVILEDLNVAFSIRYFRMLTVIAFDAEGKPLTGLGEKMLVK